MSPTHRQMIDRLYERDGVLLDLDSVVMIKQPLEPDGSIPYLHVYFTGWSEPVAMGTKRHAGLLDRWRWRIEHLESLRAPRP